MKFIFQIVSRMSQYFQKNKLIFTLFILGGIINAIVLTYSYGNLVRVVLNRDSGDPAYRRYTIQFKETPASLTDIAPLLSDPLMESVMPGCALTPEQAGFGGGGFYYLYVYHDAYPLNIIAGTNQFTGSDQILAPINCMKKIGDTVTLLGRTFTIIGKVQGIDDYYTSWEAMEEIGMGDSIVKILAVSAQRQAYGPDKVTKLIDAKLPHRSSISDENDRSTKKAIEDSSSEIIEILAAYLVAALSYIFLLRHLVDSMMVENIISQIVGASKVSVVVLIFWEIMVLVLFANGIGLLLHGLLYQPVFSAINISQDLQYYLGDYLRIILLILVASLLVSIPLAISYIKKTPVEARRKRS